MKLMTLREVYNRQYTSFSAILIRKNVFPAQTWTKKTLICKMASEGMPTSPSTERRSPRKNPHPVRVLPPELQPPQEDVQIKEEPLEYTEESEIDRNKEKTCRNKRIQNIEVSKGEIEQSDKKSTKTKRKPPLPKEAYVTRKSKGRSGRSRGISESDVHSQIKGNLRGAKGGSVKRGGTRSLPCTPSDGKRNTRKQRGLSKQNISPDRAKGLQTQDKISKKFKCHDREVSKEIKEPNQLESGETGVKEETFVEESSDSLVMMESFSEEKYPKDVLTSTPGVKDSHELAIDDLFKLTQELSALNKDSEKLTTPLHNKQTRRLKDVRSPFKTPSKSYKTPTKSPFRTPKKTPVRGSPRFSSKRTPTIKLRTPGRKTPKKSPGKALNKTPSKSPVRRRLLSAESDASPSSSKTLTKETLDVPESLDQTTDETVSGSSPHAKVQSKTPVKGIMKTPHHSDESPQSGSSGKTSGKSPYKVRFSLESPLEDCSIHSKRDSEEQLDSPILSSPSCQGSSRESSPNKDSSSSDGEGGPRSVRRASSRILERKHTGSASEKNMAGKRKRISEDSDDAEDEQKRPKRKRVQEGKVRRQSVKRRLRMDASPDNVPASSQASISDRARSLIEANLTMEIAKTMAKLANVSNDSENPDDSDEDRLAIVPHDDESSELDEILDKKSRSQEINFTAKNVKTLLRQIVANEAVLDMVRNTIREEGMADQLKEAMFEPKMTRSRIKEAEKSGTAPAWPLSPIKSAATAKPFIDMTLCEDEEEDEDYDPSMEPVHNSDDEESVVSSQASEVGSPLPVRLATLVSLPQTFTDESQGTDGEITIATRTRSKLPLKDTALYDLEANFVAPDITPDMYEPVVDDDDWQDFLVGLCKSKHEELNTTADDEGSDPEYNFLAEKEETDKEDYRDDKAVKISKKELNTLMDELFEAYGGADLLDDEEEEARDAKSPAITPSQTCPSPKKRATPQSGEEQNKKILNLLCARDKGLVNKGLISTEEGIPREQLVAPPSDVPVFTMEERAQLEDQMRKHTQLLAQSYVLSTETEEYQPVTNLMADLLNELKRLGDQSRIPSECSSAFHSLNLQGALEIAQWKHPEVNEDMTHKFKQSMKRIYARKRTELYLEVTTPTYEMMELFSSSKVFLFPQMLPERLFLPRLRTAKMKQMFTEAEDNLLAIGIEQFGQLGKLETVAGIIQKMMLPTKTVVRITGRAKNLSKKRYADNALRTFKTTGELPEWPRYTMLEHVDDVVPPAERDPELVEMPTWFEAFEMAKQLKAQDEKNKKSKLVKEMLKNKASNSNPGTPLSSSSPVPRLATPNPSANPSVNPSNPSTPLSHPVSASTPVTRRETPVSTTTPRVAPRLPLGQLNGASGFNNFVSSPSSPAMHSDTAANFASTPVAVTSSRSRVSTPVLNESAGPSSGRSTPVILPAGGSVPHSQSSKQSSQDGTPTQPIVIQQPVGGTAQPIVIPSSASGQPIIIQSQNSGNNLSNQPIIIQQPSTQGGSNQPVVIVMPENAQQSGMQWVLVPVVPSSGSASVPSSIPSAVAVSNSSSSQVSSQSSQSTTSTSSHSSIVPSIAPRNAPSIVPSIAPSSAPSIAPRNAPSIAPSNAPSIALSIAPSIAPSNAPGIAPSNAPGIAPSMPESFDVTFNTAQVPGAEDDLAQILKDTGITVTENPQQVQASSSSYSPEKMDKSPRKSPGLIKSAWLMADESNSVPVNEFVSSPTQCTQSPTKSVTAGISKEGVIMTSAGVIVTSAGQSPVSAPRVEKSDAETFADSQNIIGSPERSGCKPNTIPLREQTCAALAALTASPAKGEPVNSGDTMDISLCLEPVESDITLLKTPVKYNREVLATPVKISHDSDEDMVSSPAFSVPSGSPYSQPRTPATPAKVPETPTKSAVEIMASIAQFIATPPKKDGYETPPKKDSSKTPSPEHSGSLMKTPTKGGPIHTQLTPNRFRMIVPRPAVGLSPVKPIGSPLLKKTLKSPRRKILQQNVKAILPKGFIVNMPFVSPTKKAAAALTAKAKKVGRPPFRSPEKSSVIRRILPRLISDSPRSRNKDVTSTTFSNKDNDTEPEDLDVGSDYDTLDSEYLSDENNSADNKENEEDHSKSPGRRKKEQKRKKWRRRAVVASVDEDSEEEEDEAEEDSDEEEEEGEEDHLAALMAASTTIKFDPKPGTTDVKKGKAKKSRDATLRILAPKLVETDPMRDERDTAFAQAYLQRVRECLKDSKEKYERFLQLLFEFGRADSKTPTELYGEIRTLMWDQPDLVQDFAGFLLPDQARECGLSEEHRQFTKARAFLRKLEVYYGKHSAHLQKILKAFTSWHAVPGQTVSQLKESVMPLLRGQQCLLDEFTLCFPDEKPPESQMMSFEEVYLPGSDDEEVKCPDPDEYEEITLPDSNDFYGTHKCHCQCHKNKAEMKFYKKRRHCLNCGKKVIKGKMYFQASEKILRPLQVTYKGGQPSPPPFMEDDNSLPPLPEDMDDDDDSNLSTEVPPSGDQNADTNTPSENDPAQPSKNLKRFKLLTDPSQHAPSQGGQFVTLSSMAEPVDDHFCDNSNLTNPDMGEDSILTPEPTGGANIPVDEAKVPSTDFSSLRDEIKKAQGQLAVKAVTFSNNIQQLKDAGLHKSTNESEKSDRTVALKSDSDQKEEVSLEHKTRESNRKEGDDNDQHTEVQIKEEPKECSSKCTNKLTLTIINLTEEEKKEQQTPDNYKESIDMLEKAGPTESVAMDTSQGDEVAMETDESPEAPEAGGSSKESSRDSGCTAGSVPGSGSVVCSTMESGDSHKDSDQDQKSLEDNSPLEGVLPRQTEKITPCFSDKNASQNDSGNETGRCSSGDVALSRNSQNDESSAETENSNTRTVESSDSQSSDVLSQEVDGANDSFCSDSDLDVSAMEEEVAQENVKPGHSKLVDNLNVENIQSDNTMSDSVEEEPLERQEHLAESETEKKSGKFSSSSSSDDDSSEKINQGEDDKTLMDKLDMRTETEVVASDESSSENTSKEKSQEMASVETEPTRKWSIEQDKMILLTSQIEGQTQQTFHRIADQIEDATPQQVEHRLIELLELMQQHVEESGDDQSVATTEGEL